MPDYYPEIRRVVAVTAEALLDSKYLSDSALEIGGTLAFTLLYIGDDGVLSAVPYVTEYTQTFPIGKDFSGSGADIRAESTAEAVQCRPLAPRTVSLKAKVKSRVFADRGEDCALQLTGEDQSPVSAAVRCSVETLESETPAFVRRCFFVTGNVAGEEKLSFGCKPVVCSGRVLVDSAVPASDLVTVKGSVLVSCMVLTDDGIYKTVTKRLPIEERIGAEGCDGECVCAAYGRVASVTAKWEDVGVLSFDAEYDIDAVYAKSSSVKITEDIYSTEYAIEKSCEDMEACSLLCLENKVVSVSGEGRRKNQSSEGGYIISSRAEAGIERADIKDSRVIFTGNCTVKALVALNGDVVSEEFTVPVRLESEALISDVSGETVWCAHIAPSAVECSLEDAAVRARCELFVYAEAVCRSKTAPVKRGVVGMKDKYADSGAAIRICYPEKGRRIWDIAKECRAPLAECERQNSVSRRDISDGSPLIMKQ